MTDETPETAPDDLAEVRELLRPDPALVERPVATTPVWRGRIFSVETLGVALPDGSRGYRELVRHHGGAAVCAVRSGRICLVRQWRVALGSMTLEVPAGKLEPGEDPAACAARELEEETGLVAGSLELVSRQYGSPGFTDEHTSVYLAHDLRVGTARPDEGEFVSTVWLPLADAERAIGEGLITDAKTVTAVLAARLRGLG